MSAIKAVAIGAAVLLVLFGVVSCEYSVWSECRRDHSWLYCVRVLGHD